MNKKQVKRFHILEVTDKDVSIAFVYEDQTKEIIVMKREAAEEFIKKEKSHTI